MQQHFLWMPRFASLVYLCPEGELHELKSLIWGYWAFFKRERMIASAESVLRIVDHFSQPLGQKDTEGKPVVN